MRVSSSTTISDEELVTYNVKELNRVLKSKGTLGSMMTIMSKSQVSLKSK